MEENPNRPLIVCEYAHAMGNSVGNLKDYWEVIDKYPRMQGAFIWDWVDQGLKSKDKTGRDYWNHINYIDGANACDGLLTRTVSRSPKSMRVKHVYQYIKFKPADLAAGKIHVTNAYDFKTLDDVRFGWQVVADGKVIKEGSIEELKMQPGETRSLSIVLPALPANSGTEYFLNVSAFLKDSTLWAPAGHELAWEQFALNAPSSTATVSIAAKYHCDARINSATIR